MAILYTYDDSSPAVFAACTEVMGTESAPTKDTDGMDLFGLRSVAVSIFAGSGNFTTAGKLACYLYSPFNTTWHRAPDFDLTITPGFRTLAFPAMSVLVPRGRIAFVPMGLLNTSFLTYSGAR